LISHPAQQRRNIDTAIRLAAECAEAGSCIAMRRRSPTMVSEPRPRGRRRRGVPDHPERLPDILEIDEAASHEASFTEGPLGRLVGLIELVRRSSRSSRPDRGLPHEDEDLAELRTVRTPSTTSSTGGAEGAAEPLAEALDRLEDCSAPV